MGLRLASLVRKEAILEWTRLGWKLCADGMELGGVAGDQDKHPIDLAEAMLTQAGWMVGQWTGADGWDRAPITAR